MSRNLSGLSAWLVQRLSAVYMLVFLAAAPVAVCSLETFDFTSWRALMAHPLSGVASAMFFISLMLHLWVGIRDVILDYAGRWPALRLTLLALLGGGLIALGIWVLKVLLMVMIR